MMILIDKLIAATVALREKSAHANIWTECSICMYGYKASYIPSHTHNRDYKEESE